MNKTKIISLNSKDLANISQVGGKGYSLIKLSSLNLNVPPGIILTVDFFEDWIKKIKNSDLYKKLIIQLNDNNNDCQSLLNKIKNWCINNLNLSLTDKQDIENYLKKLFPDDYNKILYAVRSSSPEEDLLGASFAEVGGMLQHGALVCREFNKPCVIGIDNIREIIKDGEEIEVDAIEGITLLDREE
ncbi:hypothetical protein BCR32DRAFT_287136 [Anaeromyces robustus]|uniref:Pyruvate phosphate dikinase AMP/ATP-binding domain-containing protein n=1 Tax=Anaeromyces robustus TaxID=1754192 RepID=A0A1Y1VSU5_9FUNG|nr:hypothetical protein BCR32DRAFT_287136 [Anaeromyces robustus]|eukprot:ORX64347.1 hypothetical protein BCR32DRAFT_287136 [Anaeromyces robustus]